MNPVVHFEMPYDDRDRMAEFYKKAFGWQMQMMGEDMGSYVVAQTAEADAAGHRPKNPGEINGGFFKKSADNSGTSVVIAVKDINAAMKAVTDAGGKITVLENGKPVEIPGIGLYVGITDTEGNRVSLLQPKGM
jgi:predicted enzyme related to lactoylglutathione lyase